MEDALQVRRQKREEGLLQLLLVINGTHLIEAFVEERFEIKAVAPWIDDPGRRVESNIDQVAMTPTVALEEGFAQDVMVKGSVLDPTQVHREPPVERKLT